MTFLSKLGQIIIKGAEIAGLFAPTIEAAVPGAAQKIQVVSNDLTEIANLVVTVEAIGQSAGLPGPQRALLIGPQVAQILLQSAVIAGKPIKDPAAFQAAAAKIAGGVADALNAVDEGAVQTKSIN